MKRVPYTLIYGMPGLFAAALVSITLTGAIAGMFWIFVFGDDIWPAWTGAIVVSTAIASFLVVWICAIILGYNEGMRHDRVKKKHIAVSAGVTVFFLTILLFGQLSVKNIWPASESERCSNFCLKQGYAGSQTPPRETGNWTCGCFNGTGYVILQASLELPDRQ